MSDTSYIPETKSSLPSPASLSRLNSKLPLLTSRSAVHPGSSPAPLTPASLNCLLSGCTPVCSPVILCIGTDRIIGDSLGPLVGSILEKKASGTFPVYGTLHDPAHALNLWAINTEIKKKHPNSPVIAVDASLGNSTHIGSVFVRPGSIAPGSGVKKNLPPSGDIAITGIVNEQSSHPYLALQTARLSTVADMAEGIADCLLQVLM